MSDVKNNNNHNIKLEMVTLASYLGLGRWGNSRPGIHGRGLVKSREQALLSDLATRQPGKM